MKIFYGTDRTVICFAGLAFKFPKYSWLWKILLVSIKFALRLQLQNVRKYAAEGAVYFFRGVVANLTEFATCVRCKSSFLAPVYFSLGFISIQKYVRGKKPTLEELIKFSGRLSKRAQEQQELVCLHSWGENNFRQTPQGLVMIDYGNSLFEGQMSLSTYLYRWRKELQQER